MHGSHRGEHEHGHGHPDGHVHGGHELLTEQQRHTGGHPSYVVNTSHDNHVHGSSYTKHHGGHFELHPRNDDCWSYFMLMLLLVVGLGLFAWGMYKNIQAQGTSEMGVGLMIGGLVLAASCVMGFIETQYNSKADQEHSNREWHAQNANGAHSLIKGPHTGQTTIRHIPGI